MTIKMKMKDGIYRRGKVYWIQYTARGPHRCVRPGPRVKHACPDDCPRRGRIELCVRREPAGRTRAGAKARLAEKRVATAGGAVVDDRRVTFEDLAKMIEAEHTLHRRKRAPNLTRLTAAFAGRRAVDIDRAALERYVADRRSDGAADATVKNELAALRHAFNLAGLPWPKFPMPEVKNTVECWFTVTELDALLRLLPDDVRPAVEFAALTGLRKGNVFGLTWDDVRFDRGEIVLHGVVMKNGDPLTVPFAHGSRVEAILRGQQGKRPFDVAPKVLRKAWAKAVGRKGLDKWGRKYDARAGGFIKVRPRFHDLRHTFAQMMSDAGAPESEILALGGWKTRAMLERYKVGTNEAKLAAIARRDAHMAAERGKAPRVIDLTEGLGRRSA